VNGADTNLARVLERGCYTPVERFGADDGWQAGEPDDRGCNILHAGMRIGTLAWDLLGRHNELNALAAIVAARYFGIAPQASIDALARFRNVKRRLERIGEAGGVTVYDDFAHH